MSNIIKNKKTIVLFQSGSEEEIKNIQGTIDCLSSSSSYMVKYRSSLNMPSFVTSEGKFCDISKSGSLKESLNIKDDFFQSLSSVITLANNNKNKFVLVPTYLTEFISSFSNGKLEFSNYNSITNQAIKLEYIINAIKTIDPSIDIILVGHSQSGLVNLEVATKIPDCISKIISISTPYSAVSFAKNLCLINLVTSIFEKNIHEIFNSKNDAIYYQKCVEVLSSNTYFENLKLRWNNLKNRPKLIVITSVSGLLYKNIPLDSSLPSINSTCTEYKGFDGLVTMQEQTSIEHATIVGYTEKKRSLL